MVRPGVRFPLPAPMNKRTVVTKEVFPSPLTENEYGMVLRSLLERHERIDAMSEFPLKKRDLKDYSNLISKFRKEKNRRFGRQRSGGLLANILNVGPSKPLGY